MKPIYVKKNNIVHFLTISVETNELKLFWDKQQEKYY